MRKRIIATILVASLFLPGCSIPNWNIKKEPAEIKVWWGTKQEIINFLDSPNAKANRWMIEAIGE